MATQVRVSIPSITVPRVHPDTGVPTDAWYRFDETMFNRTGGINGDRTGTLEVRMVAVEDDVTFLQQDVGDLQNDKADKAITVTAGNGLTGGGTLAANFTFDAVKNTGWTAATGTANKGVYATYNTGTASAGYVQAELQSVMDALQAATRRIKALEDALRLNGGIDG